jgi:hypothetical protein
MASSFGRSLQLRLSCAHLTEEKWSALNTMSTSQTNHSIDGSEVAAVLTSWIDIARYVGKGVRTVQRWERELGFPVRRTKPGEKGSVLAVPREIDSWVKSQQFTDGRLDTYESDQATLLRSLLALRIENRDLRAENRELQRQLASRRSGAS